MTLLSERGSLHDQLVDNLGARIVSGRLPPGSLLISEQIGAEYGVSRSVVREAFRVLEAKGLLRSRPRIGTKITSDEDWNYLDPQVLSWRLQGPDRSRQVHELLTIRRGIEPLAARLAATRSAEEPVPEELERSITEMSDAMERGDLHGFVAADITFHMSLLTYSNNRMFGGLRNVLTVGLRAREVLAVPFSDTTRVGLQLHSQLVENIRAGDMSAEQTMRSILERVDLDQAVEPHAAIHG